VTLRNDSEETSWSEECARAPKQNGQKGRRLA